MISSPTDIKRRAFMLLGIPAAILYAFLMFFLKEKFYCLGITDCKIWGSFASKALFFITSIVFFSALAAESLYKYPIRFRMKKVFAIPFGAILIIGSIAVFAVYLKTTADYLETRDINLLLNNQTPYRVSWNQISSAGRAFQGNLRFTTLQKYRYCYMFPYIVLQNKYTFTLVSAVNDYDLVEYLKRDKNIKEAFSYNECYR